MKESIKKFIEWTKLKIRIHLKQEVFYFHEREIWRASLGINIGHEQAGKNEMFERPALILKKFNNDICWVLPLTSRQKVGPYYYRLHNKKSVVILSQLRLISGQRLVRKIDVMPELEFAKVKEMIKNLL